ncbi:MAG: hypothetical protein R2688_02475 [Fimbriimonadaceae bacterium]
MAEVLSEQRHSYRPRGNQSENLEEYTVTSACESQDGRAIHRDGFHSGLTHELRLNQILKKPQKSLKEYE